MKRKIDIAAVPELSTSVGMQGALKQQEVWGPVIAALVGALIYAL